MEYRRLYKARGCAALCLVSSAFAFIFSIRAQTPISKVDVVSLDIAARDKAGKPVADLKPEELEITDGGSPVKITSLRAVTPESGGPRLVTLVFDQLNRGASKLARNAVDEIVKAAPPSVSFAILKIEGRLRLVQDFTAGHEALKKAIAATTANTFAALSDSAEKELTEAMRGGATGESLQKAQAMYSLMMDSQRKVIEMHMHPSIASLLALAGGEGQFQGRKAVVYIAEDMHPDASTLDFLYSAVGSANRSGVTFYVVDVGAVETNGGLAATSVLAGRTAGESGGLGTMINEQMGRIELSGEGGNVPPFALLSRGTGGIYMSGSDSVKKPAQRMIDDLSTFYEVSYTTENQQYNGRWRAIGVKVLRPGVKVDAPIGYKSLPPESGLKPKTRQ
jgi:VWFA-related protein